MIAMSKSSNNIFWYGLGMLVLAYVLTRMADMILLVAASALVGFFQSDTLDGGNTACLPWFLWY